MFQRNTKTRAVNRITRPEAKIITRNVRDSRWVHRNQIKLGMYVSELDRPWSDTAFMFQGFYIDSHELLSQVQESCEYALVQTEKLAQVSTNNVYRFVGEHRLNH